MSKPIQVVVVVIVVVAVVVVAVVVVGVAFGNQRNVDSKFGHRWDIAVVVGGVKIR